MKMKQIKIGSWYSFGWEHIPVADYGKCTGKDGGLCTVRFFDRTVASYEQAAIEKFLNPCPKYLSEYLDLFYKGGYR